MIFLTGSITFKNVTVDEVRIHCGLEIGVGVIHLSFCAIYLIEEFQIIICFGGDFLEKTHDLPPFFASKDSIGRNLQENTSFIDVAQKEIKFQKSMDK
jgi:hypothetical protein